MQENKQEKSLIKQNILSYLMGKDITPYEFYKKSGVTRGVLTQKNGISEFNIARFLAYAPDVNVEWLITGVGEMYKSSDYELNKLHNPIYSEKLDNRSINLYNINAAANLKTMLADKTQNIIGQISIPNIPDCDGAINVSGDSMYPLIKSGDVVAYKEIHSFNHLIYGEIHLVSFEIDGDDFLVVKYLKKSNITNYIQLVSYNAHHEPMDIPLDSISALAIVKFSIRRHMMR